MTDITTTLEFPYAREGVEGFTLTSDSFPSDIDIAEAGKLQLRMRESDLPRGDYEFTVSAMVDSGNLSNIPTGRLTINGGALWDEFTVKVDSINQSKLMQFTIPMIDYSGATTDFILQFKKSLATDVVGLSYCNMTMRRVN